MRIALLSSQWPGVRLGGIGAYTAQCAPALAAAGHEVHVFTLSLPPDARPATPGYILHEIAGATLAAQYPQALPMGDQLKYRMATQRAMADAVAALHAQSPLDIIEAPEYEAPARLLIERQLAPVITHLHSGSAIIRHVAEAAATARAPDQEQILLEALELEVIAGSDALCAPSAAVARDTQTAYAIADLTAHAAIVPLPFALPDTPFVPAPPNAPLLFVGRLEHLKGADILAEAAVPFLRRHPNAALHIAGPDTLTAPTDAGSGGRGTPQSMAAWMRNRLAEFGPRVVFLGERTAAQVAADMRGAAAVVIPSRRESYSYVCCEALAAGRPVIVSAGTGAAEVAGDAGIPFTCASAVALAEAMDNLWADAPRREELARRAWSRARETLAPARTIAQRLAFYQRTMSEHRALGTAAREERYFALPESHAFRILTAQALAEGDSELVAAFAPQADLPPPTLTAADRLMIQLAAQNRPVRFYLYGAGRHTARLLLDRPRWESQGHALVGLIDDHPRFAPTPENPAPAAHGIPVISCAAAAQRLSPSDVVVLSTDAFEEQFWTNTTPLRANAIPVLRLYTTTSS